MKTRKLSIAEQHSPTAEERGGRKRKGGREGKGEGSGEWERGRE